MPPAASQRLNLRRHRVTAAARSGAAAVVLLAGSLFAGAQAGPAPARIVIETAGGTRTFQVEIAADEASRERGLMGRRHLAANAGMLFDFGSPVMTAFWMKDTPISLDILFVRADGSISTVAARATPFSETPIPSAEPIRAAIEINGGLSAKLGITSGSRVRGAIFPGQSQH